MDEINVGIVQNRLDYGLYVHIKVQNPRQKSRAWTTIHKIFDSNTLREIDGWFFCTECNENKVFSKDISKGTGPLLNHQKKHADERAGYDALRKAATDAAQSLTIANALVVETGQAEAHRSLSNEAPQSSNQSGNAAEIVQLIANSSLSKEAPQPTTQSEKAVQIDRTNTRDEMSQDDLQSINLIDNATQTDGVVKYHNIGEDDLPVVLANLASIIHKHGLLTEADFRAVLPAPGEWLVFTHKSSSCSVITFSI